MIQFYSSYPARPCRLHHSCSYHVHAIFLPYARNATLKLFVCCRLLVSNPDEHSHPLTNSLDRLAGAVSNLSRRLLVLDNVLHKREGQDLLDGVVVRQEHDDTVDAHSPTTSGRQTVLECLAKGLVDELCLVVTLRLLVCLLGLCGLVFT